MEVKLKGFLFHDPYYTCSISTITVMHKHWYFVTIISGTDHLRPCITLQHTLIDIEGIVSTLALSKQFLHASGICADSTRYSRVT